MDELVGKFARRLSLEHFADLLDLALNGLSEPGLGLRKLVDLVAAATLLLHNAPEGLSPMIVVIAVCVAHSVISGSSKVTQAHFSGCLQLFAGRPQFLQDPELQEKSLHFVASQLTNRVCRCMFPCYTSAHSHVARCSAPTRLVQHMVYS